MQCFDYVEGVLCAEQVGLDEIAERFGTPAYVYSRRALEQQWLAYDQAFGEHPHLVCYAVKANSNLAVLNLLARLGAGFDIVSVGELERVLKAGGRADTVIFSGVGKRVDEMERALEAGIRCFNVESIAELEQLSAVAQRLGGQAPVSLRVNPDVDAGTHPYISTGLKENKFGIAMEEALAAYRQARELPGIRVIGLDCHIGSQLTETAPFEAALQRLLVLLADLDKHGIELQHLDLGGGVGICYRDEQPPSAQQYVAALMPLLQDRSLEILIEPGRSIAGNSGVLLTRVEYLKPAAARNFVIVDAAMNDLMRPALYAAWQAIQPVRQHSTDPVMVCDVVGPVCETGDFLGKDRNLAVTAGDLLAVMSAGAYGFTMSSNYNTRPRAAEVLVDGEQIHLVRRRETLEETMRGECLIA